MATKEEKLHRTIEATGCPIFGVSIGDWSDARTWRIHFNGATALQQAAGIAAMTAFDPARNEDDPADSRLALLENRVAAVESRTAASAQVDKGQAR